MKNTNALKTLEIIALPQGQSPVGTSARTVARGDQTRKNRYNPFHATTWPACYVEWWFGDGAPGLDRERPMLFEDVARRLIDIEEHEYTLATDDVPYVASCQSRFNNPEIIAVMGDVVRRMRLLKGTRAAIGRKGFDADLKALASATSDEFMEAMSIAGPMRIVDISLGLQGVASHSSIFHWFCSLLYRS